MVKIPSTIDTMRDFSRDELVDEIQTCVHLFRAAGKPAPGITSEQQERKDADLMRSVSRTNASLELLGFDGRQVMGMIAPLLGAENNSKQYAYEIIAQKLEEYIQYARGSRITKH